MKSTSRVVVVGARLAWVLFAGAAAGQASAESSPFEGRDCVAPAAEGRRTYEQAKAACKASSLKGFVLVDACRPVDAPESVAGLGWGILRSTWKDAISGQPRTTSFSWICKLGPKAVASSTRN